MKKIIFCFVFLFVSSGATLAQTGLEAINRVKQIRLLEADRKEVERNLADFEIDDTDEEDFYQNFSNDVASITVSYSSGSCAEKKEESNETDQTTSTENADEEQKDEPEESPDDVAQIWNTGAWKATKIVVWLDDPMKIETLGFDLSTFKTQKNPADDDIYFNKDLGIAFVADEDGETNKIIFFPSKTNSSKLCNTEKAKKFSTAEDWFGTDELRNKEIGHRVPDVTDLILSATEIKTECADNKTAKNRSKDAAKIKVATVAVDPENDVMTYEYVISGGKIVGMGANVVWDLTDVAPGTYTITASVDDSCGVCGKTVTKAVVIKATECPAKKAETKAAPKKKPVKPTK